MQQSRTGLPVIPSRFNNNYEDYAKSLASFLLKYQHLFNYFTYNRTTGEVTGEEKVVHFLVKNQWDNKLPEEWQVAFSDLTFEDLLLLSTADTSVLTKIPSHTFREFVEEAVSLYMISNVPDNHDVEQGSMNAKTKKALMRGVKAKKQYEIEKLGKAITEFAKQAECSTVVDIGAGQGYLSQYISLHANEEKSELNVIGIDGNELQTRGANRRVQQIEKSISDNDDTNSSTNTKQLHHVTAHLSLDIDHQQFLDLVRPYLSSENAEFQKILLIGLHTCGDLARTMMKIFLQTDSVALVNVGCCYHKLTEDCDLFTPVQSTKTIGYPLSSLLQQTEYKLHLSTGKYLACYSLPEYKDLERAKHQFKMHSYRAALELYLYENVFKQFTGDNAELDPQSHFAGHVPHGNTSSFEAYALFALKKMHSKLSSFDFNLKSYKNYLDDKLVQLLSEDQEQIRYSLSEFYKSLKPIEGDIILKVQAWCAIRSLISPVLEALILVDRLLFLREQPQVKHAELLRVFHPSISPRGVILTAEKI